MDTYFSYPPLLSLARLDTPLQPLDRLSQQIGGPRIWIKRDDLTGSTLSGNKVRKLEYVLAHVIANGFDTVITCGGIQSNHCRTTALLCAQLGLHAHLVLRGEAVTEPDGNLLLDQLAGADIEFHSAEYFSKHQPQLLLSAKEKLSAIGRKPFVIPTGASDGIGIWGYIAASKELAQDFNAHNINPHAVYCASGSGGTQAGLTVGLSCYFPSASVVGVAVCDSRQYFEKKVEADIQDWHRRYGHSQPRLVNAYDYNVNVNDNYIGPGYAKAQPEVWSTIRLLASQEGIVLDPVYTGKAFLGMLTEIKKGTHARQKDIVFIHTGGVFGLFPQKQYLAKN